MQDESCILYPTDVIAHSPSSLLYPFCIAVQTTLMQWTAPVCHAPKPVKAVKTYVKDFILQLRIPPVIHESLTTMNPLSKMYYYTQGDNVWYLELKHPPFTNRDSIPKHVRLSGKCLAWKCQQLINALSTRSSASANNFAASSGKGLGTATLDSPPRPCTWLIRGKMEHYRPLCSSWFLHQSQL